MRNVPEFYYEVEHFNDGREGEFRGDPGQVCVYWPSVQNSIAGKYEIRNALFYIGFQNEQGLWADWQPTEQEAVAIAQQVTGKTKERRMGLSRPFDQRLWEEG